MKPPRTVAVREYTLPESAHGIGLRIAGLHTVEASSSGWAAGHRPTDRVASESNR